eukprot:5300231-Lingulodinium_polyedra.AAC.1
MASYPEMSHENQLEINKANGLQYLKHGMTGEVVWLPQGEEDWALAFHGGYGFIYRGMGDELERT